MTQKDLFEFAPRATPVLVSEDMKPKTTFSFLEQTRFVLRLDQVLAGTMALMVGMAVVYGFGVEGGRRMERQNITVKKITDAQNGVLSKEIRPGSESAVGIKGSSDISAEAVRKVSPALSAESTLPASETPVSRLKTRAVEKPKGAYTIQLATYKEESIAQKKIQALTLKGLSGFLVPSGAYYLVCVNGFEKRQQASQSLTRLKSKGIVPKDAYVRMIPA